MNRDVQTAAQKEAGQEAPSYFDLLMDGKSDGCLADYEQYKKAKAKGMTCEETESTVWALVFNQTHTAFCNQQVRQGFIRAIDRSVLEEYFQKSKQENLRVYDLPDSADDFPVYPILHRTDIGYHQEYIRSTGSISVLPGRYG